MQENNTALEKAPETPDSIPPRRGAIGKAFLVWLGSGSVVLAIVAFLVFRAMGC